mgnify:FL=1
MKRITCLTALLASAIFVLISCGGNSSDPVRMAREFAEAYLNADYDKCNKMMDDEEFTPSGEMSSMENTVVKAMKEEAKKMKYVITLDEEYTDVSEYSADVYFDITSDTDPDFDETIRVRLEKEDNGKWIVDSYKAF